MMMKEAREIKDKMINDAKEEAQAEGVRMIERAKAAITLKKCSMAEIKSQVSNFVITNAEKSIKRRIIQQRSYKPSRRKC
jgi:F-type H+-transporting ATPase subunit b